MPMELELESQAVVSDLMQVLGTKLGSFGRTVHALKSWAVSPAPTFILILVMCICVGKCM